MQLYMLNGSKYGQTHGVFVCIERIRHFNSNHIEFNQMFER